MRAALSAFLLVAACEGGTETPVKPDIDDASACGDEVTGVSITFTGVTGTTNRQPVGGVIVSLEDRWSQPAVTLGEGTSAADGRFTVEATGISYLDNCWSSTDFVIQGEAEGLYGELSVSREIHGAILDGTYAVDLGNQPLYLSAP